jgi:hypothetical protein
MDVRRILIAFYLVLFGVTLACGQGRVDSLARFQAGGFFGVGIPTVDFSRHMETTGFGLGFEAFLALKPRSPVWIGLGFHSFEFDSRSSIYVEEIEGYFYEFREKTASRLFVIHMLARYQPPLDFLLQPYIQMQAGYNHFFTNTKIEDTDLNEVVDRFPEHSSSVPGYALMAGVNIVPSDPIWAIDLRVGYFGNPSTDYLVYDEESDTGQTFPIETFDERQSSVQIIGLHLGVRLAF